MPLAAIGGLLGFGGGSAAAVGGAGAVGAGLGAAGAFLGSQGTKKEMKFFERMIREGIRDAQARSSELAGQAFASPEFTASRDFLLGLVGAPDQTADIKFQRRLIRQSQAGRGTFFSPAAADDEARRLFQSSANLRLAGISQLLPLVGFEERFRQSIFNQIAEENIRHGTGGRFGFSTNANLNMPNPFASAIAGALGGFQAGTAGFNAISSFSK